MAAQNGTLKNNGNDVYPKTLEMNVYDGNGNRLDQKLAQMSSDLASLISTQGFTSSAVSIAANSNGRASIDISKTGYTFLGVVAIDSTSGKVALQSFSLVPNTTEFRVYYYNPQSTAQSVAAVITALYIKNL